MCTSTYLTCTSTKGVSAILNGRKCLHFEWQTAVVTWSRAASKALLAADGDRLCLWWFDVSCWASWESTRSALIMGVPVGCLTMFDMYDLFIVCSSLLKSYQTYVGLHNALLLRNERLHVLWSSDFSLTPLERASARWSCGVVGDVASQQGTAGLTGTV